MIRALTIQTSSAAGSSITPTDTFTPVPNSLLVLWIGVAASPSAPTVSSVIGWGLTWTQRGFKAASTSTAFYCYTAMAPNVPTDGTFTITTNITGNVVYILDQIEGVDVATPIVTANIATSSGGPSTTASLTYPQTPGAGDHLLFGCCVAGYDPNTPQSGWTVLSDQYRSTPSVDIASQISPVSPGTTGSATFVSSNRWATIGLEVTDGGASLPNGPARSPYDMLVLDSTPVAYIGGKAVDYTANHGVTAFNGTPASEPMPNGDPAWLFNGSTQYLQIGNDVDLSPDHTGYLTIEAWIRPDVLQFSHDESSGYVHWAGKGDLFGTGGNIEWMMRMYDLSNSESRPNRISGYVFNPPGGFGIGSEWQDPVTAGEWIHVAFVINTHSSVGNDNQGYPYDYGYVKAYKNGVLRDQDALDQLSNPTPPFNILMQPVHGTAPVRIGTDNFFSYFEGAIGKFTIYDSEIDSATILSHYNAMYSLRPSAMAKIETLHDDFELGTPNPTNWGTVDTRITQTSLGLTIPCTPDYAHVVSANQYDLSESQVFLKVDQVAAGSTSTTDFRLQNGTYGVRFAVIGTTLHAQYQDGGAWTDVATVTYDAALHNWWMITESIGVITWLVSADGVSYSEIGSSHWTSTNPTMNTALSVYMDCGSTSGGTGDMVVRFLNQVAAVKEKIVLDPMEVATERKEFDITSFIGQAGPDWGDAQIQQYVAEAGQEGQVGIDFTIPNRTITIPLVLLTRNGVDFTSARRQIQQKVARFQEEGGWIKRETKEGMVFAEVVNAQLKLGGSTTQALYEVDPDASLQLTTLPPWIGPEINLGTFSNDDEIDTIITDVPINGDHPGRVRMKVIDVSGNDQHGAIWAFRSRHLIDAETGLVPNTNYIAYEGENLTPMGTASVQALAGASGGSTMRYASLPATSDPYNPVWTPVLSTKLEGGLDLTHVGTYRVFVRAYATGSGGPSVRLRLTWEIGDLLAGTGMSNAATNVIPHSNFYLLDLGLIRPEKAPVGFHRWQGHIEAMSLVSTENIYLDKVWIVPAQEGIGVLRSLDPSTVDDCVIYASMDCELRTDGQWRLSRSGEGYGPIKQPLGDLPRIPVSGMENRAVEVFVKVSNGTLNELHPDSTIGMPISMELTYAPSYLFVGGT